MKTSNNSSNSPRDVGLFVGIAIITIIAFFCTYYFTFHGTIKALIWTAWFILSALLMYFTALGKRIVVFGQEAKVELFKVVWPTRQETIQTTSIVMIMVAATGFILWGIDSLMIWTIAKITHIG